MLVSDKEFVLLKAINNSRRMGLPQSPDTRDQARELLARALVAEDQEGLYVPDDVKFEFFATGQSLGR